MRREGSREERSLEGLREERTALVHRYTVAGPESSQGSREVGPRGDAKGETDRPLPSRRGATDYVIEVAVELGVLWRWSLFELVEISGDRTQPSIPGRSLEPVAKAGVPRLSRRSAIRAAERAARALSTPVIEAVPRRSPSAATRSPKASRSLVLLLLLVLAVALIAGAIVETRGNSHHARTAPLTPPPATRSASPPKRPQLSARRASQLNEKGYSMMRSGNYAAALPLLERAVGRLRGTGSLNEAYAEFNLANTLFRLGKCDNVVALLDRSQRIQGSRVAIDTLRGDAQRRCR